MPRLFVPGFPDIPEDKKIDTIKFIEACEKIPSIFDLLGGKIFSPVKNDVIGNIEKIKKRYLENPVKFATLDDIIEVERHETDKKLKAKDGNGLATNALMWLKRGLKFILLFLEHLLKNDYDSNPENLKSCAKLAYKALALREGLNEEETLESARVFSINFRATVDTVYELFDKTGVEKFHKV
ncbi:unnamed protein product [Clavelina lepadiformis]|uniref:Glycolipid transfer protein domain-containing protein n=1 Tax=Clavelina lepadiformis TaxID=159417 RepID=A0ABP0GS59_CLALP